MNIDDIQFMADDGECLARIAARTGIKARTIIDSLRASGHVDLIHKIAANAPAREMSRKPK